MMGHLPYGPVTQHIQVSNGADCNQKHFYVTEYSSRHGKEDFTPRHARQLGTGYKSNFRPGLYYNMKLDEIDNPMLGNKLQNNYTSITSVDFQPPSVSSGHKDLPKSVYMTKSGFVKDVPQTLPSNRAVKTACYNPNDVQSKQSRSLLYNLWNKDPIEKENDNHGPSLLSTENHSRFLGEGNQRMDISLKSVGPKEGSGFIHAYNNEPITYRPNECFDRVHNWKRLTGQTAMKSSFQPIKNLNGTEEIKLLSKRAERQTGYTREIKPRPEYTHHKLETYTKLSDLHQTRQCDIQKNDMAQYFDCLYANQFPSMTNAAFKGLQKDPKVGVSTDHMLVDCVKQDTGFTQNNCKFIESAESPRSLERFNTHYTLRFYNKNPKQCEISSKRLSNTMKQSSNGFMKSTKVHQFGKNQIEAHKRVESLHPYVAKSIQVRDPYAFL